MKDLWYNKKIIALLRIKTHSFRKTGKEAHCVCSKINQRESFKFIVYVFFFFLYLSFGAFCDLISVIVQILRNLSVYYRQFFFLRWIQEGNTLRARWARSGGQLKHRIRLIFPTGAASSIINSPTHIHFICVILVGFSW